MGEKSSGKVGRRGGRGIARAVWGWPRIYKSITYVCDSSRVALTCSSNGPEETTRETTTRGSARQIPFLSEGKAGTRYLRLDSRDIGTVQNANYEVRGKGKCCADGLPRSFISTWFSSSFGTFCSPVFQWYLNLNLHCASFPGSTLSKNTLMRWRKILPLLLL